MRLNVFFNGKLSREEMASAFLACLLDQRDDFRAFFFHAANMTKLPDSCQVGVEIDNVDIRIDCGDCNKVVLIEVKVRRNAIQSGQLSSYFGRLREREPDKQVAFIMVVPGKGSGAAEIQRLRESRLWREKDQASTVTWSQLAAFADQLSKYDRDESFINSGFEMILKMIEDKGGGMYSAAGGRDIVLDLARRIAATLEKEMSPAKFQVWSNRDALDISPYGSLFSPSLRIAFDTPLDDNGVPITPITDQDVRVRAETMYGISNKGKRNPRVNTEWQKMRALGTMNVTPDITHQLKGRWYCATTALAGTAADVEARALNLIRPVVEHFKDLMFDPLNS
jgi:hypothetical protein